MEIWNIVCWNSQSLQGVAEPDQRMSSMNIILYYLDDSMRSTLIPTKLPG